MKYMIFLLMFIYSSRCFCQVNGIENYDVQTPYFELAMPRYLSQSSLFSNSKIIERPGYRLRASKTEIKWNETDGWEPQDSTDIFYSGENYKDKKLMGLPLNRYQFSYALSGGRFYLFDSLHIYKFLGNEGIWSISANMHQTIADDKISHSTIIYPLLDSDLIYENYYTLSQDGFLTACDQVAFNKLTGENDTIFQYDYGYENGRLTEVYFIDGAADYAYYERDRNYFFTYNPDGSLNNWNIAYKTNFVLNTYTTRDSMVYQYDADHNKTSAEYFYAGRPEYMDQYTYESGRLASEVHLYNLYGDSLMPDYKYEYSYNDIGKPDSVFYYFYSTPPDSFYLNYIYVISYNDQNLMSHISVYDAQPSSIHLQQKYVYIYDSRNYISSIMVKDRNPSGEMVEAESYTYIFDEAGNFIYFEAVNLDGYHDYRYNYYYEKIDNMSAGADKSISLNIYPNPARDLLNIYIPYSINSANEIAIYNSLGQVVYSGIIDAECNCRQTIDISSLRAGIYFVELKAGPYTDIQKLVVD